MRAFLCAIEQDNLINIVAGKGLLHDQNKAITQNIVASSRLKPKEKNQANSNDNRKQLHSGKYTYKMA